ncbi:MAG: phage holin family protein [Burkholderiales bacterium]
MAEAPHDRPPPQGETLRGALAKFAEAMLGLVRTRIELAALEYTEERDRVGRQLALLLIGLGCLLFCLFFGAFAVIAYYWDTYRLQAILGVAAFFGVIGGVLLWRRAEVSRMSPAPFAASVGELEKDRAALARTLNLPPSP